MTRTRSKTVDRGSRTAGSLVLLLIVGGVSAAAGLAELALRIAGYAGDYERETFRLHAPYDTIRRDSWALRPMDSCKKQAGEASPICVNGRALAGKTRHLAERPRVLFLGDSGTQGWGVEQNENFPALLRGVDAVNAGVYGFHTFDALRLYRTRLAGLESDAVILGLFMANDLNYNLLASELHLRGPADSVLRWLMDRSALAHFVYSRAQSANHRYRLWTATSHAAAGPAPFSRITLIDERGLHMLDYRQGEIAGYLPTKDSALMDHAYELLERALREFQALARGRKTRFGVILLPAPPMIAGTYFSPIEPGVFARLRSTGIELHPGDLDPERPTRRVLAICRELQIECLNPAPALRAHGPREMLRENDDHYSAHGHEILAREIAPWLARLLRKKSATP